MKENFGLTFTELLQNLNLNHCGPPSNGHLAENQITSSVRFDIIAVVKNESKFEIEHIEDAFYPFEAL